MSQLETVSSSTPTSHRRPAVADTPLSFMGEIGPKLGEAIGAIVTRKLDELTIAIGFDGSKRAHLIAAVPGDSLPFQNPNFSYVAEVSPFGEGLPSKGKIESVRTIALVGHDGHAVADFRAVLGSTLLGELLHSRGGALAVPAGGRSWYTVDARPLRARNPPVSTVGRLSRFDVPTEPGSAEVTAVGALNERYALAVADRKIVLVNPQQTAHDPELVRSHCFEPITRLETLGDVVGVSRAVWPGKSKGARAPRVWNHIAYTGDGKCHLLDVGTNRPGYVPTIGRVDLKMWLPLRAIIDVTAGPDGAKFLVRDRATGAVSSCALGDLGASNGTAEFLKTL